MGKLYLLGDAFHRFSVLSKEYNDIYLNVTRHMIMRAIYR